MSPASVRVDLPAGQGIGCPTRLGVSPAAKSQMPEPLNRRRSQRLPLAIPLFVTSLDPEIEYGEPCETTSVNSHGISLRAGRPLRAGTWVRLDLSCSSRVTSARVLGCRASQIRPQTWHIAMELEEAHNFWGIREPPRDWVAVSLEPGSRKIPRLIRTYRLKDLLEWRRKNL